MESRKEGDDIPLNENRSQPVHVVGAVSGSAAVSAVDFAFMMQMNKKHKGQNKSHNHLESKKANIRRNEKYEREFQKEKDALIKEQLEKERIEWAPADKDDEKFQQKMKEKMQSKGPSNKEINARLLEEEEKANAQPGKQKKNGWGKQK